MTGLLDWFRGLSGRERRLVVVAAVLGLAVVLVEGVGVPLAGLWQDARADHDARLAQAARLVRQLDELGPPSRGRPAPLAGLVAQGAGAGLVIEPPAGGGGQARIVRGSGASAVVLGWLEGLPGRGWVVRRLVLAPLGEGTISFEATLAS